MTGAALDLLLVEDDPNDIELTLHAFRRGGLANRIQVARDGAEAIDFLLGPRGGAGTPSWRPGLILLDLKLPKMDGLEVLRRVREDGRTRDIPVVVLSSSKEDRDLVGRHQSGVNGYLVKPIDFAKLSECAREVGFAWLLVRGGVEETGGP